MSRFYGSIRGSAKTVATRQGHDSIVGHIRGWSVGAEVRCQPIGDSDRDEVTVEVTSGSGYGGPRQTRVARLRETLSGIEVVLYHPKTGNVVARHELKQRQAAR